MVFMICAWMVLIILTIYLFFLLDNEFSQKMGILKQDLITYFEKKLDKKILYQSISPSILMTIEIRDLRIVDKTDLHSDLYRIKKLQVTYNLFQLLFSPDPLDSVGEVRLENSLFKFALSEAQPLDLSIFDYNFKISGSNIGFDITTDKYNMNISDCFFDFESMDGSLKLDCRKGKSKIVFLNDENTDNFWMFSNFKLRGTFNSDLQYSELFVNFLTFSSPYFALKKQTFQVTLKDNIIDVRKIMDKAPLDVQFLYDLNTEDIMVKFETEKMRFSDMITLSGPLHSYNKWLESSVTSDGKLTANLKNNTLDYVVKSDIDTPDFLGLSRISIRSDISGDEKQISFNPLKIKARQGFLEFMGNILYENFFPEGILHLVDVKMIPGKELDASFDLKRQTNRLYLKSVKLSIGATSLDMFTVELYPIVDGLGFDMLASFAGSENDTLSTKGNVLFQPVLDVRTETSIRNVSAASFYRLIAPTSFYSGYADDFFADYTVDTNFTFNTDFTTYDAVSPGFKMQDSKNKDNFFSLGFRISNEKIAFRDLNFNWNRYTFKGDADFDFHKSGRMDFVTAATVNDIPYALNGKYLPSQGLFITGSYELDVAVIFSGNNDFTFNARAAKFPLPLRMDEDRIVYSSFNMNGIFPASGKWQIVSPETRIHNIPLLNSKHNSLDVSFTLNKEEFYLNSMVFEDEISALLGSGRVKFPAAVDSDLSGDVYLRNERTDEAYHLLALMNRSRLDFHCEFSKAPTERIGKLPFTGVLTGTVNASGEFSSLKMGGKVALEGGRIYTDPLDLRFAFDLNSQELSVRDLYLNYINITLAGGEGALNLESGTISLTSTCEMNWFSKNVHSTLNYMGNFAIDGEAQTLDKILQGNLKSTLYVTGLSVDKEELAPWSIDINQSNGLFSLSGGPDNAVRAAIDGNGEFFFHLIPPFPIVITMNGVIRENDIDATIENVWVNSTVLNVVLANDMIRFVKGYAKGNNLKIKGIVTDPDYAGKLDVTNLKLSFSLLDQEIKPISAILRIENRYLKMPTLRIKVGDGVLLGNAQFAIERWIPKDFRFKLTTDEITGVHIVNNMGPVLVEGYAKGDVEIYGTSENVSIEGSLRVRDCKIALNNESRAKAGQNTLDLNTKLDILLGKRVEFYWPSLDLPVLRFFAATGSKLSLDYDGRTEDLRFFGDVAIKGGEVFYFNRNFYLREGNISFKEQRGIFDPRISLRAEIREMDENNEDIRIYLVVENQRLSEFSPHFESNPSMSNEQIIALLGGPIKNQFEESGFGPSIVLLSTDIFSQFGIFRPIEQKIRDYLNIDIFSIRTPIVQNFLLDKIINTSSEPTSPSTLGKYIDNTMITMGQFLGEDILLTGALRFRDVNNYPDFVGLGFFGVLMEFELNMDWPTPFFDLEWSFNPKLDHLDDFFLTDNSIKFEWSFSY
ncbi:MAG: translocation/assembly module TamB domain-containing protein [Spirochaetales bacterium]|nr:translocation/assembly module TamB domain-containing protein [Spirochaetales bacterium]